MRPWGARFRLRLDRAVSEGSDASSGSLHLRTHAHEVGFLLAIVAHGGAILAEHPHLAGIERFDDVLSCTRPRPGSFGGAWPSVPEESEELTTWN